MDKFSQFGIEPILLLAQVVNFLILLYILKRFLYKPILGLIKKREEKIKVGLEAATKGEAMLVKAREEEKTILQKANVGANEILGEVKKRAKDEHEALFSQARKDADDVMIRAREQIVLEQKQARALQEKHVLQSAILIVEKVLPKALTKKDHERILGQTMRTLKHTLSL